MQLSLYKNGSPNQPEHRVTKLSDLGVELGGVNLGKTMACLPGPWFTEQRACQLLGPVCRRRRRCPTFLDMPHLLGHVGEGLGGGMWDGGGEGDLRAGLN